MKTELSDSRILRDGGGGALAWRGVFVLFFRMCSCCFWLVCLICLCWGNEETWIFGCFGVLAARFGPKAFKCIILKSFFGRCFL